MREGFQGGRDIVLGRNSSIWRELSTDRGFSGRFETLSHRDLEGFEFEPGDRIWILAYSRDPAENEAMFAAIRKRGAVEAVYVSTATTNVVRKTGCYGYPTVKHKAERAAQSMLGARILVIGLVYQSKADLPAGTTIATSYDMLKRHMAEPAGTKDRAGPVHLFEPVDRPFGGRFERTLFDAYGVAMAACGRWPCLLRPIDLVLRAMGYRWYGYLFLSNRLWSSTIS